MAGGATRSYDVRHWEEVIMFANVPGYLLNVGVLPGGVMFGTPTSAIIVVSVLVAAVLAGILADRSWWGLAQRRNCVRLAPVRRMAA